MPRSTFRRIRLPLAAALALAVQACADRPEATPTSAPESAPAAARALASTGPADDLARGLALALSAPGLRQQVLEDMRDSPFPQRRLHLASYLRGQRGASLARAAARSLGMTPGAYLSLISRLPEMELHFDRPYDRSLWTGTADVAVAGIGRSFEEMYAESGARTRMTVHTTGGETRSVLLDEKFGPPLLLVRPAKVDFGADPEARRAKAPRRSGRSITTRQEEESVLANIEPGGDNCDPATAVVPCVDEGGSSGGGGYPTPTGYQLAYTYSQCVNPAGGADADQDGILDDCEAAIAHAFRPGLRFDSGEQHSARDPYWTVRRSNSYSNALSVMYMMAYHRDNGEPFTGYTAHDGDGEFMTIAARDIGGGRWALETVTWSAHWHAAWDRTDDRRYYEARVQYSDGTYRGRVRSWVAQSKHANYGNADICNDHYDYCYNPQSSDTDFDVFPDRNIGNYWASAGIRLFTGCARPYMIMLYSECFWTDDKFRGWRSENGDGGDGYKYPLQAYGF
jgi:hypothetical protein